MTILKLGQIHNNSYLEDLEGNVLLNTPSFPLYLYCELLTYLTLEDFPDRTKVVSLSQELIKVEGQPENIREAVYQQLLLSYPELIK